jgi:hypothetical protein
MHCRFWRGSSRHLDRSWRTPFCRDRVPCERVRRSVFRSRGGAAEQQPRAEADQDCGQRVTANEIGQFAAKIADLFTGHFVSVSGPPFGFLARLAGPFADLVAGVVGIFPGLFGNVMQLFSSRLHRAATAAHGPIDCVRPAVDQVLRATGGIVDSTLQIAFHVIGHRRSSGLSSRTPFTRDWGNAPRVPNSGTMVIHLPFGIA